MADVTVSELAKSVGASVDRLLLQMGQAGLPQKTPGDRVSDDEKQTLLAFLKMSHGENVTAANTTVSTGSGALRHPSARPINSTQRPRCVMRSPLP